MKRFLFLGLAIACGACEAGSSSGTTGSGTGGDGTGGSTSTTTDTTGTGGAGTGGGFNTTSTGGGGPTGPAEVFGHSSSTLYKLNPDTKQVSTVGTFSGCGGSVIDIALDKDSKLYGTTFTALFAIDRMTAQCTKIKDGSYPNSLSFVPAGTLDATKEALVGFVDDQYVRIDPTTGAVSNVGSPWNNSFISSGDVVSVINGPTYLTIKDETGSTDVCRDCLVEIDPKTGAILKDYGPIGYDQVFGTAFWDGQVYGFTNAGELFEITINGNTISTSPINVMSGLSFYGAGSTTSAPVPQ